MGFRAAGAACGIKAKGLDLAVLVTDLPAAAAGTFTTNRIQAAPVKWCRAIVGAGRPVRAVVVNSGNANACNGARGLEDTRTTAAAVASCLDVEPEDVLVCSTGPIGVPLPVERITGAAATALEAASTTGAGAAARAIMTTDTVPKFVSSRLRIDGREVTLTGLAKGSGMIEPNMATMLAFLLTDAAVEAPVLQGLLREAVAASFNRITVDGDRSTNDTVLLLANGAAQTGPLAPSHPDWAVFREAVFGVTRDLALKIVRDGEGATRVVTVRVTGAATGDDAERAARAIANSLLVKTSWAGADPIWGRVMDAVGYSGAEVVEEKVDIHYDGVAATLGGVASGVAPEELVAVARRDAFTLRIDLGLGAGEAEVYTCDLTRSSTCGSTWWIDDGKGDRKGRGADRGPAVHPAVPGRHRGGEVRRQHDGRRGRLPEHPPGRGVHGSGGPAPGGGARRRQGDLPQDEGSGAGPALSCRACG